MSLNNNRLREILNQIEMNTNMKNQYASKWHSIVNFFYNNTGLAIAQIAVGGSMAKRTNINRSDMDVIFCLSPDQSREVIYPKVIEKLNANFGQIASNNIGNRAIHVSFGNLEFDLVLLSQREFQEEYNGVREIKQMNQTKIDVIKLIKYAVDRAGLSAYIQGYIIEQIVLKSKSSTLIDLINECISQLPYYYGQSILNCLY